MALLLFMCGLFWGAHKSLAPRARTLLGGLGQATLSFFAVATLLFVFFFVGVLNFATSPNSGVKFFGGFLRSGKKIFRFFFSGGASFSWFFIFLLLRSRDCHTTALWSLCTNQGHLFGSRGKP